MKKKALLGLSLLLALSLGVLAAEWVADGTIEGKYWHLKMDTKANTAILSDSFGEDFTFHISCVHHKEGWVSPNKIINQKVTISQEEKKVTISGEYPQLGEDLPVPVEFWYKLTDTGKVQIGFKFDTTVDVEKIYRARLHLHSSREPFKEKGVIVDGIVKALLTDPTGNKSLFNGKASEIIYFNDEPTKRILFKPINTGDLYLNDFLASERLYFELGFFVGEANSVVVECDIDGK